MPGKNVSKSPPKPFLVWSKDRSFVTMGSKPIRSHICIFYILFQNCYRVLMYPRVKFRKISHKPLVFENSNKTLKKGFSPNVSLSNSSSSQYLLCTACLVMFSVRRCLVLQCPSHRVPIPRMPHTVLAALSAS